VKAEESHRFAKKQGADIMATTDNRASCADDPLTAVKSSDKQGWNALIERYQPIINSVCRSYRLTPEDAADVSQTVWMKVVDNLDRIREPRAIPAWIKTTAIREALALLRTRNRLTLLDVSQDNSAAWSPLNPSLYSSEVDARMLDAERQSAVRDGLAEMAESHRALLSLLVADPPISYQQISDQLGLPVGSIGPTRARCLRKLASTPAIRSLELGRNDRPSTADAA
jgi:RNA polymerase sigma factor (sigma-70 family)